MKNHELALYVMAAVAAYVIINQPAPAKPAKPVTTVRDPLFGPSGWYYQDGA